MRVITGLALLAAALVTSTYAGTCHQMRTLIATCPQSCWDAADYGSCNSDSDASCLCNEPAFVESVSACVEGSCSASDVAEYQQLADEICTTADVRLTRRLVARA